ncbi:MAG TPA: hypothetical protein VHT73_05600 [Thermodesulfobacteriota bacterium]|nr:hypothetical protein [Thermodesulfobacteriota bacterium]
MLELNDFVILGQLEEWKRKSLEEEKEAEDAHRQGKKRKKGHYAFLIEEARKILSRKNTDPIRESPTKQSFIKVSYELMKEKLGTQWKQCRDDSKKKKDLIRSYIQDSAIALKGEDLDSLHNAVIAILAWKLKVSKSTIRRVLRAAKKPKDSVQK